MTLFGKAFKFIKNNVVPAAVAAATGNIGGAAAALLKKNTSVSTAATVGNTANTTEKPALVLGYESQNGGIVKADFLNTSSEIQTKQEPNYMLWILGGLAALFGAKTLMK